MSQRENVEGEFAGYEQKRMVASFEEPPRGKIQVTTRFQKAQDGEEDGNRRLEDAGRRAAHGSSFCLQVSGE